MLSYVKDLIQITEYPEPKQVNNSKNYSYGRVDIDETKLDIFDYDTQPIAPWKPSVKLTPYGDLTKLYLDIETAGLDPGTDRIYYVGLRNHKGQNLFITHESEHKILSDLVYLLCKHKPDILFTFNGFEFDLPFIIRRCEILGVTHPFRIATKKTIHATAQKFGQPSIFYSIFFNEKGDRPTAVIDLYHQLLAYDFVARKLTRHSLKEAPLQLKLRKESRLDLGYKGILKAWKEDRKSLEEYLKFDLEDTQLLADFLTPAIYYQKEYLPDWKLQAIATAGNGSKWNHILKTRYGYDEESTPKLNYQGALTFGLAGYYENIAKIDVKSLYPNCQLVYGIHSDKDRDRYQLSILKYALEEKDRLEELGKTGDIVAKHRRGTTKVIANSGYGALGSGIPYNDYKAAAMVTAYGRAIFRFMFNFIEKYPNTVITGADTDGLFFAVEKDLDGSKRKQIYTDLQAALPKGIEIAYELTAKSMFIPKSDRKPVAINDVDTSVFNSGDGIRKNYVIVLDTDKLYLKGKYVKRNRSQFEREFLPKLVQIRTLEGEQEAFVYYQAIRQQIEDGTMSTDYFKIERKASVAEKIVVELGLVDDDGVCTYWEGYHPNPSSRWRKMRTQKTNTEPYCIEHYLKEIDEAYGEVFAD
jgi:DNA polymerase, archaea type